MSPSWVPARPVAPRQQAAVWAESRLASPKTTGLPWIQRIGWTTWTCWPTTAVMYFERVSAFASDRCSRVGACWYSVPQWMFTITASAPARRARRAAFTIRPAFAMLSDHECGMRCPLVSAVYARNATFTPFASRMVGRREAAFEQYDPV